MPQTIKNGQGFDVTVSPGQSLRVDTIAGAYSAQVIGGTNAGTVLATNSTASATHGPYATGAVIRLTAGNPSVVSFDVAATPIDGVPVGDVLVGTSAPSNSDGRPDGTIYIQTA